MVIQFKSLTDYRFTQGNLDDLMQLAYQERRETNRITCKCCGRSMMSSQQAFEVLYTCSTLCYENIAQVLNKYQQEQEAEQLREYA